MPLPIHIAAGGLAIVLGTIALSAQKGGTIHRRNGMISAELIQPRDHYFSQEVDMHDIKERFSLLWIFALMNYLYADVIVLFAIAGSRNPFQPLPPWALMASAVLMEIPIAMILACRLLPFRANRLGNINSGGVLPL